MSAWPADEHHDVVVVGAGSAGCVLAARLSAEPGRRVLVLEAGPVFADLATYPEVLRDERTFPQEHLWRYEGFHAPGDVAPASIVRGRVLGGSGAVNGLIWQRGLPEDYDAWGVPGWGAADFARAFDGLEDDVDAPRAHADGEDSGVPRTKPTASRGPVPIGRTGRDGWAPAHAAFHDAARDLGAPVNPDLARAEHQGVGPYARNAGDGHRMGAALTHLLPASTRPNLTVRGDVQVQRVVVREGRAAGVEARIEGRDVRIAADEVVLCAGAVETPQLLVHSGIGPQDVVRRIGREPLVDLPGVGAGLSDHPSVVCTVRFRADVREWDLRCLVGLVATSSAAAGEGRRSDLQTLVMSGPYVGNNGGHLPAADPDVVDAVLNPILYAPASVGRVEVLSADPGRRPRIHYGYLDAATDRERLREGVRAAAAVLAHPAFVALVADDRGTPDAATLADDDRLDAWIRTGLHSTLHGCGTCRMGPADDPDAVVDADLRVRGVDGLRVVDLSIAPRAPTAPTNATAMAIGELAAERI